MKKISSLALLVASMCGFGFLLSCIGYETAGNILNDVGTLIAGVIGIVSLFLLISFSTGDSGPPKLLLMVLSLTMLGCLLANIPLSKKINWAYVQYDENPSIAAKVAAIQSDEKKVQALRDFMAGKEIPKDKVWFAGENEKIDVQVLAIHRILGVSAEEAKKIEEASEFPVQVYYYKLGPDLLENWQKTRSVQLVEANK